MAFLTLFAAWLVAIVSPGPDFLAVVRTAASRGRHQGYRVGAGVVTGIACWATLALTGLSLLLARFAHLYLVLRAVGAVFLLLYGAHIVWATWRSRGQEPSEQADDARGQHPFRLGLATNLANPKAVLFFGALFASVLPPHLNIAAKVLVVLAMLAIGLAWFGLVAALAGSPAVMRRYRHAQRALDGVAGGLFVVVGAALLPR